MTERDERPEPAIETLRVSRVESRTVLDHQITLLDEIDDKALRTVRTSIVVLALLVSAGQIAGPPRIRTLHWISATLVAVAVTLFAFAIVAGMAIFSVSNAPYGIGPTHRSEAMNGDYSEREWLTLLLDEYDGWTMEARALTRNNARWFTYVLGSFVVGVLLLVTAILVSLASFPLDGGSQVHPGVLVGGLMDVRRVQFGEHR